MGNKSWGIKKRINRKEVLRALTRLGPSFTAKDVWLAAQARDNELHKYIDWNQKEAAEKWQLHQCRMLIASVSIAVEEGEIRGADGQETRRVEQKLLGIEGTGTDRNGRNGGERTGLEFNGSAWIGRNGKNSSQNNS